MNHHRQHFLPFLFLLLATLALVPREAKGFGGPPGGPYSNGSYFPNDGTFSAVVRGENLTGTLQFSTTEGAGPAPSSSTTTGNSTTTTAGSGGVGSTGVASIFFDGDTYFGNSQGVFNSQASTMSVAFQADAEGQGEQQFEISTIVDLGDLITTTTTINPDGSSVPQKL